jgi:N-glycosylase/DNA lyase
LLRQDAWEALGCFLCSATKQVVQIREMVRLMRERHGEAVVGPCGRVARAFPTAERLASLDEGSLRACKLGFRAPNLLMAARAVAEGRLELGELRRLPLDEARARLMGLRGVGRKVADCVLLFGLGFEQAFPVDVWVRKALARLYFPRARRLTARRIERFSETHFGPHAGLAQQYLFHHARTRLGREWGRRVRRGK